MAITRERKLSIKKEVGTLVAVTAQESANLVKFGLRAGSNVAEALYLETASLVHGSRMDHLSDRLEASVEAIESLSEYGHTEADIKEQIETLRTSHIANVLALAK